MTHNTARSWAVTLGITSALALTGCTASNGAATPTSSDTTTHSTAPPQSGGTATSPAGSAAPSATQPGDSGTTAPSTPSASDASSEPVGAPGATTEPTEPAPGDQTGDTIALSETYTAPDGAFSMKYPASWTAKTDQGYLELTSPTGQAMGRIATTDVRPLREDWFTSPRYTVPGETTQLSEDIGAQVSTYSAYLRSAKGPDEDSVLFGLSQVNSSGLVSLAGGETGRELWVEFSTGPVNTTGRFVTDEELVDILNTTVATHPDVPAIQAMLHSISMDWHATH